jgi:hypothetical protein
MSIKVGKITIRPEIEKPLYWFHLMIIAAIVLLILQIWKGGSMLTISNIMISTVIIGVGDITSHSILKLD